jgi:H+/gluconate symporter-like permease
MSLLAHSFDFINSLPLALPNPPPAPPPGFEGPVGVILGWVKWVALIVAVLGVIIIGGKRAALRGRRLHLDRHSSVSRRLYFR